VCREVRWVGHYKVRGHWPDEIHLNHGRIARDALETGPMGSLIFCPSIFRTRRRNEATGVNWLNAVENVMLLLWGGVIVDWILAAPVSISHVRPVISNLAIGKLTKSPWWSTRKKLYKLKKAKKKHFTELFLFFFFSCLDQWFPFFYYWINQLYISIQYMYCVPYWMPGRDADAAVSWYEKGPGNE
jgi:hypothetical protein